MKIDVSVVIVSFNTKNLTLDAIKSVISERSKIKKEIIVVDNGSDDGSLEELIKLKNSIKLIKNNDNLGFAKANNQGIKEARGNYIFLLNSDTRLKDGAIEKLVAFAQKTPLAGVVAPRLFNIDGTIQGSVFRLPTFEKVLVQYWLGRKGLLDKYYPRSDSPVEVEAAVMAAFLITPEALRGVGLLDERYFMYFEDMDYCKRVRESGLKVYYLPTANVFHHHGASGSQLASKEDQWRRLIPSSKIYHGVVLHYLINFVIWLAQKRKK